MDFGYGHPFVCFFGAVDPDGRSFIYREMHRTERLVEDHARTAPRKKCRAHLDARRAPHNLGFRPIAVP
jgi:phage terminase large subunit